MKEEDGSTVMLTSQGRDGAGYDAGNIEGYVERGDGWNGGDSVTLSGSEREESEKDGATRF
jgi:hypothetical protein